jgi:hypothetical protein
MNAQHIKEQNAKMRDFLDNLSRECDDAQRVGRLFDEGVALNHFRKAFPREFISEEILAAFASAGMTAELLAELQRDKELYSDVRKELNRQRSREIVAKLRDGQGEDKPWNDGLLSGMSKSDLVWRCDGLLPVNARLLIQAQYKAGKTTFMLNFARCLIHGGYFLGRFETTKIDGLVGYLNYEVSGDQFSAWAEQLGINADRVYVNNLRGMPNPFASERDLERLAERLRWFMVDVVIVDPYARAFDGDNLDQTGPAVKFTNKLDQLAEMADLTEIAIVNHTGHDKERGRNSTVLNDWADTIVTLTRDDKDGARYVKAIGRDVELAEDRLDFDPETKILTLSGTGSRKTNANQDKMAKLAPMAAQMIAVSSVPLNGAQIEARWKDMGIGHSKGDGNKAAAAAHGLGVRCEKDEGPNRPKWWAIVADVGDDEVMAFLDRGARGAHEHR